MTLDGLVFVEQKPREGREIQATPDAVIGREGTDIVLQDPEVSRRHAAIRVQGDTVAIEDLGSTNGTFVNDERIEGLRQLSDGDVVRFGNTVWGLRASAPAGATTVGQVAAPQVTAARAVPAEPAAPQPAAPQPPAPPAPPSAAPVGARGDVPAPPEVVPSAIRRVVVPPTPGNAPAFLPPAQRRRGSAATRVEATVVCLAIALAVAVAIAIYFASQG
jgi:predicted component of type VI protein secretion system